VLSLRSCGYAPVSSPPGCPGGCVADRRTVPMAGRRGRSRCAGDPNNDTVPVDRRQGKTTTSRVTNRGGTTTCSGLSNFVLIHAGGAAVHAPSVVFHAFRAGIAPPCGRSSTGCPQGTGWNECSVLAPGPAPGSHLAQLALRDRYGQKPGDSRHYVHGQTVTSLLGPESGRQAPAIGHTCPWVTGMPGTDRRTSGDNWQ
jgi:hypothetical protein